MLSIAKLIFLIAVGLSATAAALSKFEWGNTKRKSSIEPKHIKQFKHLLNR